ncbi:sarcosine oxidase [Kibdelosporangium banguiense]|uniref:Sarcosine oxidase n=1 Tax=Kibdelosporangium banguiense TaxID=1365924 RepID=A0ABS4TNH9_9PSEU|nr:FAD-dependent oxidoreductase [Kibdelosporangium banguiense]MBP2325554.1 sarcosine oxidase [Kibdelosporangium banguiense]
MEILRADVVVVGLGAFGSAALWRLAQRGLDVVGVERHGVGHEHGSSHGETRLFRVACMEHPGLAAVATKSLELWTELGRDTGETLVRQTGCLNVGAPDSQTVQGPLKAGVPVDLLTHEQLVARQPQYAGLRPDDVAVWDPGAGICYPERNVRAHVKAAQRLGARIYLEEVVEVDGATVRTQGTEFRAGKVVVAAGAGLSGLVGGLPLVHRPTPLNWFAPKEEFTLPRFPAFIWDRPEGGLWGHGSDEGYAVKIGVHPETMDIEGVVAQAFPGLDPKPVKVVPCHVTDSPDGQFLLGGIDENVIIAGGDSGHGFKHAAGIGELLAQMATGENPYCAVDFLDPARFRGSSSNG